MRHDCSCCQSLWYLDDCVKIEREAYAEQATRWWRLRHPIKARAWRARLDAFEELQWESGK